MKILSVENLRYIDASKSLIDADVTFETSPATAEQKQTIVIKPAEIDEDGREIKPAVVMTKNRPAKSAIVVTVPYTISTADETPHGAELRSRVLAGEFGPIAEATPPLIADLRAAYDRAVRSRISAELRARGYDATWRPEIYAANPKHKFNSEALALVEWITELGDALDDLSDADIKPTPGSAKSWADKLSGPKGLLKISSVPES